MPNGETPSPASDKKIPTKISTDNQPPRFAVWSYWASISLVILFLLANLFLAIYSGNVIPFVLLGIAATTVCVILWVGHVTMVRAIDKRFAFTIWTTLILSLLTTTAGVYRRVSTPPAITIESVLWLNDANLQSDNQGRVWINKLEVKQRNHYPIRGVSTGTKDVTLPLLFLISGFQKDDTGNFRVDAVITVFSNDDQDSYTEPENDKGYLSQRSIIQRIGVPNIEKVVGSIKGKVVYITVFDQFNQKLLSPGKKRVHILVRDKIAHTYTEYDTDVFFD